MKPFVLSLFLICSHAAHAETLNILTEDYPPYNFKSGSEVRGAATEQIHLILKAAGIDYTIEVLPWARAYRLAEKDASSCVYTTGHSAERSGTFKWVEPLLIDRMVMVRTAQSDARPASVEDAKRFSIGTQRDDFSEDFLKRNNFPKIDLAANFDLTLKKLLGGRLDLMMTSEKTFETMKAAGQPIEAALVLGGRNYGLACNLAVSDTAITRMQAELDRLIADGTQDRIFAAYGLKPNR
ncbi:substrate-binding periplasmic protein [Pararhizobium sp.]|uniref:substrate-binding periplasmic protein n=1 Tax=Pararhizobium sp. TaxID=1977563 RepID=UPI00271D02B0|nr:transporter substrate-binding domain-containing protein [Pararhizobium sp.]MDO9414797.1 transporter substrate-binding domain-containing protein [Pararhizobium sp.]